MLGVRLLASWADVWDLPFLRSISLFRDISRLGVGALGIMPAVS